MSAKTAKKLPIGIQSFEVIRSDNYCWYNGYSSYGEPVYNPSDILLYLQKGDFRPYWFETGTPTFLTKFVYEKKFFFPNLENLPATEDLLNSFDIDFIEPENLLFQTGYLTIKKCESTPAGLIYYLTYPNKEVKISLNRSLARFLAQTTEPSRLLREVYEALRKTDLSHFEKILKTLFASIPHDWSKKNEIAFHEGFYASLIYSFIASTGLTLIPEDTTNKGKIDLTIIYEGKVFLLEFKVVEKEGDSPEALQAIKERGYAEKYLSGQEEVYLLGIDFSSERKNILHFVWEKIK